MAHDIDLPTLVISKC